MHSWFLMLKSPRNRTPCTWSWPNVHSPWWCAAAVAIIPLWTIFHTSSTQFGSGRPELIFLSGICISHLPWVHLNHQALLLKLFHLAWHTWSHISMSGCLAWFEPLLHKLLMHFTLKSIREGQGVVLPTLVVLQRVEWPLLCFWGKGPKIPTFRRGCWMVNMKWRVMATSQSGAEFQTHSLSYFPREHAGFCESSSEVPASPQVRWAPDTGLLILCLYEQQKSKALGAQTPGFVFRTQVFMVSSQELLIA